MSNQNRPVSPAELGAEFQKFATGQNKSEALELEASQKSVNTASEFGQTMQSQAKTLKYVSIISGFLGALSLVTMLPIGGVFAGRGSLMNLTKAILGASTASVKIAQGVGESKVANNTAGANSMMKSGQQTAKGVQTLQQINQEIMKTAADEYTLNAVVVQAA